MPKYSYSRRRGYRGAYSAPAIYTGRGGIWKSAEQASKRIGRIMGPRVKSALENRLVGLISGGGAYTNSLIADGAMGGAGAPTFSGVPQFSSSNDETGTVEFTHREYLTDIYGPTTTAFTNQTWSLNPGLFASFPFLAQIAANFDEYEFKQLMYYYRSTTSDIGSSTSGQVGSVIAATQYNAADPPFTDKGTMMEYDGAMSCKTTEHMGHGIECDPKKRNLSHLFVRSEPVPDGEDKKTYDQGVFNLAVVNSPAGFANLPIGELWVAYTVRIRKPRLFVARALNVMRDQWATIAPTSNNPLGTGYTTLGSTLKSAVNSLGGAIYTAGQISPLTGIAVPNAMIDVVFPASMSGCFVIQLYYELGNANTFTNFSIVSIAGYGNCVGLADIRAADNAGVVPSTPSVWSYGSAGNLGQMEVHCYATSSTGNVNNGLRIQTNITTAGTHKIAVLDVAQYNNFGATPQNPVAPFKTYAGTVVAV